MVTITTAMRYASTWEMDMRNLFTRASLPRTNVPAAPTEIPRPKKEYMSRNLHQILALIIILDKRSTDDPYETGFHTGLIAVIPDGELVIR
jgi:hypothetical protein